MEENHDYPFGQALESDYFAGGANPYRYNGKERVDAFDLGWYDYGARWYAAELGRWGSVDPLADEPEQVDKSPYAYVWNNPIKLTDPDGKCPSCIGAAIGASIDYATQVAENLADGKDLAQSLTDIDGKSLLLSGVLGAAGGGLLSKAGKILKIGKNADDAVNLADDIQTRAKDIQNAQKSSIARNKSTTAVAEVTNPDGTKGKLVASSRNRLTPAQREVLKKGEKEVVGKGHAEETIINHASNNGQKGNKIAASRPVCERCQEAIKKTSAKIESPIKKPKTP